MKKNEGYDKGSGDKITKVIAEGIIEELWEHGVTAYDTDVNKKRSGKEEIVISIKGLGDEKGKVNIKKGAKIKISLVFTEKE